MNRYIGAALLASALGMQMQLRCCAQTTDQVQAQVRQLQPAMSAKLDTNLRGPIGSQSNAPSPSPSAQAFTTSSPYSYSEPKDAARTSIEAPPVVTAPSTVTGQMNSSSIPSQKNKHKGHGFSPVGALLGVQDRAVKSSLGLTDRTAKAGLGVTGKTAKEVLKVIF